MCSTIFLPSYPISCPVFEQGAVSDPSSQDICSEVEIREEGVLLGFLPSPLHQSLSFREEGSKNTECNGLKKWEDLF